MRFFTLLAILSPLGLAACVVDASIAKDSPPEGATNVDGGNSDRDGSLTADAASTTPDAGNPGTDGAVAGNPTKAGAVFASFTPPSPGDPSGKSTAFAFFEESVTTASTSTCVDRDEGPCRVTTCPGALPPSTKVPKHAGMVDVAGVQVQWDPSQKRYSYVSRSGAAWTAGQEITLSAYSPGLSTPLAVSKAVGIPLTWTSTTSNVTIALSESGAGASTSVTCTVPGPSAGFTVPAAALRDLSAVAGPQRSLQLSTSTSKALVVDGYRVNLTAVVGGPAWSPEVSP
jgi:hypothetical protein